MPLRGIMSTHLIAIIDGLAVTFLAFLIKALVTKAGIQKRADKLILSILIFFAIALGYVPFFILYYNRPENAPISSNITIILFLTSIIQIAVFVILFVLLKKKRSYLIGMKQSGESFKLNVNKIGGGGYPIKVKRLFSADTTPNERFYLDWATFGEGIDNLFGQLKSYTPTIRPDAIIGINHAGMVIATYLAGRFTEGDKKLGYIKTKGKDREIDESVIPPLRKGATKSIILVDCEVKSGRSISRAVAFLQEKYGKTVDIKIAVLIACKVKGKITDIGELAKEDKGIFTENIIYLPDFLSYICNCLIEPPGEIC
jgi:hypoxanthine phosphoribosyltransferase